MNIVQRLCRRAVLTTTLLLSAVCAMPLAAAPEASSSTSEGFYLKERDRVVFYGDSITDQRLYTAFVETFVLTRFPKLDVTFIHSGWGGDRVSGGSGGGGNIDTRLNRDVFAYNPTVMTVMLGMNDGRYRPFDQTLFDTYRNGLSYIVTNVRDKFPDVRLTMIQPSPYDDVTRAPKFPEGYNSVMIRFGEAVKEIAATNHAAIVDFNAPLVAIIKKVAAADTGLAEKILPDRIHPRVAGHLIMAEQLLVAWNAHAIVTDVAIDASAGKFTRTENTQASALRVAADTANLTWTQLDAALPMPVDTTEPEVALAIRSSDFVEKLNQQPLRITGLKQGSYDLLIDSQRVGNFTAEQLSAGINLAVLETPMTAQAAEVHKLTLQHTALHQTRWRAFQVPYANAASNLTQHLTEVLNSLDKAETAAIAMQRVTAQPVTRRYELKQVTARLRE